MMLLTVFKDEKGTAVQAVMTSETSQDVQTLIGIQAQSDDAKKKAQAAADLKALQDQKKKEAQEALDSAKQKLADIQSQYDAIDKEKADAQAVIAAANATLNPAAKVQ